MKQATKKQCELIDELMNRGAIIPENHSGNPSNEMFESFVAADKYIKKWGHLMRLTASEIYPIPYTESGIHG